VLYGPETDFPHIKRTHLITVGQYMNRKVTKYNDGNEVKLPEMNPMIAQFILAKASWLVIVAGWAFVVFSFLISWEQPASGAVLVGCVIAAEILFERERWRKLPSDLSGRIQLQRDSNSGFPVLWGPVVIAPANKGKLGALISLSKESEIHNIHGHQNPYWIYKDTVARVEKSITYLLAFSAIFGTLLWGYGHLLFKQHA